MIDTDLLQSLEPMVQTIAKEYGAKARQYGADQDDFAQELRLWLIENASTVEEWHDLDLYTERDCARLLAGSLRNEAKDYFTDVKAQALGYERVDLHWYSKGEVKALLPAMFNEDSWHEPPKSEGRSTKAQSEGGNWIATLADVSRAYSKLKPEDRDLLAAFHRDDWTNAMMADSHGVTDQVMSNRHDRAIGRLVTLLGGTRPDPMREATASDPAWRGRHAVPSATARAIVSNQYDED